MSMHTRLGMSGCWLLLLVALSSCRQSAAPEVVVYSSVDEIFATPVAERFEAKTGIAVRLVPDTEETKSTGLLNRLIAEKNRPQADVFWSGDPLRAEILKEKGVSTRYRSPNAKGLPERFSDPDGYWTGFSARARVIVYNRDRVSDASVPTSVNDLLATDFEDQACIANPLFGTTSMHAAALFATLGDERARAFFERFVENGGRILSSNGEVRRRVSTGECAVGITDTDDANVARIEGSPIGIVYPDADGMGTLIIPNAAVLIAGAPHPATGKRFIDYLLEPGTEELLARSQAAQMPLRPGVPVPKGVVGVEKLTPMEVNYARVGKLLAELSSGYLKDWVDRNI